MSSKQGIGFGESMLPEPPATVSGKRGRVDGSQNEMVLVFDEWDELLRKTAPKQENDGLIQGI